MILPLKCKQIHQSDGAVDALVLADSCTHDTRSAMQYGFMKYTSLSTCTWYWYQVGKNSCSDDS